MRNNLPEMLRAAAKEWREGNKVVGVGEMRYDAALEEAANAIEELEKRIPKTPHGRLIDADALYEKFARLESEAMNALKTTNTGSVNWIKWSAILTERTGYKHDIADAPAIIQAEEGE